MIPFPPQFLYLQQLLLFSQDSLPAEAAVVHLAPSIETVEEFNPLQAEGFRMALHANADVRFLLLLLLYRQLP